MRITLVHPAGFNFVPGQPDFSVLANRMPPIGIMQLASWLEKFGHGVQLHDCLGPYAPPITATDLPCRSKPIKPSRAKLESRVRSTLQND